MFQKKLNTGTGERIIEISQPDTVTPEKTYRVTVEKIGNATGSVLVTGKYILCDTFNSLVDELGNQVAAVNLSLITEPKHFYFSGDISTIKFTPIGVSGNYNAIVVGW